MALSKIVFKNGTVRFFKKVIFGVKAIYADDERISYKSIDEVHIAS